jgi:hypothetical protein
MTEFTKEHLDIISAFLAQVRERAKLDRSVVVSAPTQARLEGMAPGHHPARPR